MSEDIYYTDIPLDRAAHRRPDEDWIHRRLDDPHSWFVPMWRDRNLLLPGDRPAAIMIAGAETGELLKNATHFAFLGLADGRAVFAVDLADTGETAPPMPGENTMFGDLREVGALTDQRQGALLAYARGLLYWHRHSRFCGICGHPTESREAGHVMRCTNSACGRQHFPRSDPAVIMLVTRDGPEGDACLLCHQGRWPDGMYSTLAGFVEPGESLEQAVAREVMEEAGVEIANIRYHSSQPWPFPSSLMLGYFADALSDDYTKCDEELEDLQWFTRQDLADGGAGIAQRPRSDSIARRLIDEWIRQG